MTMTVDVRCPISPQRLLMKLRQEGERPTYVPDGNLMELVCRDCSRAARRDDSTVVRVVHRYNFLGELVESEIVHVRADTTD